MEYSSIAVISLIATETHMPISITQYYSPPRIGDFIAFSQAVKPHT